MKLRIRVFAATVIPALICLAVDTLSQQQDQSGRWVLYNRHNSGLATNHVEALALDSSGIMWIGTDEGLYSTIACKDGDLHFWPMHPIRNMALDTGSVMWMIGYDDSVRTFSTITHEMRAMKLDSSIKTGAICADRHGNVWIGGYDVLWEFHGESPVRIHTKHNTHFIRFAIDSGSVDHSCPITCLAADMDTILWVGINWGGIVGLNIHSLQKNTWLTIPFLQSQSQYYLAVDGANILWIAQKESKIARYRKENHYISFYSYAHLDSGVVRHICPERPSLGWLGMTEPDLGINALMALDTSTETFTSYGPPVSPFEFSKAYSIKCKTSNGNKYIGTDSGLIVFNEHGAVYDTCGGIVGVGSLTEPSWNPHASPNPFKNETHIYFSLQNQSYVQIVFLDALGRRLGVTEQRLEAGPHTIKFVPAGPSRGAYYYVIRAGGRTSAGAMHRVE